MTNLKDRTFNEWLSSFLGRDLSEWNVHDKR